MKKFILLLALVFCLNSIHAQIRMNSSGNVGLGDVVPTTYRLDIGDDWRFLGVGGGNALIFDNNASYTSPGIYPYNNNSCCLGKSDRKFNYIYTYGLQYSSDRRQKENIKDLKKGLDIILEMQPVMYDIKKEF